MMRKNCYHLLFTLLICLLQITYVSAQEIPSVIVPGYSNTQNSVIPILGYTSDTSLFGGILLQRINYGENSHQPFLSNGKFDISGSLKGDMVGKVTFDRTRTFQTDIRSTVSFLIFRSQISHFFGIGNNQIFSDELYEEDFFFYEQRQFNFKYRGRKTLTEFGIDGKLDLFSDLRISYLDALEIEENSLFAQNLPEIRSSGWINKLGLGFIADDRDSEFNPTEGFRYEAGIGISHSFLGSDNNFSDAWLELRHYLEIFPNVIIAHKIRAEHIVGEAPFWALSTLGNEQGLRGYHLNRFRGDSSILNVLEARMWLFSLFEDEIRLGGQLFWDSGRVFSENDSNQFFGDWKQSFGFGTAISLFNPDFIIRADIGFSDEAMRIYAGIGYTF
jgi:outer membrane protein assembly factor BamA